MTTWGSQARQSPVRPSPVFLGVVAIAVFGGVLTWNAGDLDAMRTKFTVFLLVMAGWVVTLCLHEFMHAYMAWRAGDRDVEARGYLTLNPLKYSHPLLSIVLPLVFIALGGIGLPGGAVYVHAEQHGARAQRLICGAGPAVNVVFAIVLLAAVRLGYDEEHAAFWCGLSFLAFLQITAAVLNLLPIPGMDGYGILEPSLSHENRRALEQFKPFAFLIVMAALFVPAINSAFFNAMYWLFELSGMSRLYPAVGGTLTQFWR